MRGLRRHATFANITSLLALFVALGGTATAALLITGKNVKDSSLTGADIKNRSLTGKDVRKRSLLANTFKDGHLPRGPQGPQGPQGPKGDTGTVDASNHYTKSESDARYLAAGGQAADANLLDGLDSGVFGRRAGADNLGSGFLGFPAITCAATGTPRVTVNVGPAGAIAVYASAEFSSDTSGQLTQLQIKEPVDFPFCQTLLSTTSTTNPVRVTAPGVPGGTTATPGGFVILPATPGTHTYEGAVTAQGSGGVNSWRLIVLPL